MGKKVGKKARSGHKGKRVYSSSTKIVPRESNQGAEIIDEGASVFKERRACVHLDKGVNIDKVSSQIGLREPFRCEDCREGVLDRRASKGKGKQGKRKGGGFADSKVDSKAIWICLECGHFSCGGVGLPTNPQGHAIRHARQSCHPLVIHAENPHLRWCFPCSLLVPVDKSEEGGENKDVLSDIVNLIKKKSSEGTSVDVEDVWFGSGSVASDIKSESSVTLGTKGRDFYTVRGLVNLGNTCFFNSVMQNLLAMERLREYLLKLDGSVGPLTNALKKFFVETGPGTGVGNVVSPKSLFGYICAKAPQFRGYRQQDSHELLRYLLDGLSSEELSNMKLDNSSPENGRSRLITPTFVDAIFGGQLSSTVCCVECRHSSVVFEPFLDLSLPVPIKKPPSKKAQTAPRARKTKLPPRRGARTCPKHSEEGDSVPAQSAHNQSTSWESSHKLKSPQLSAHENAHSAGGSSSADVTGNSNMVDVDCPISQNCDVSTAQNSMQKAVSSDDFTWLEFIQPMSVSADVDPLVPVNMVEGDGPMSRNDASAAQNASQKAVSLDNSTWLDYLEPMSLSDNVSLSMQSNDIRVSQDSESQNNAALQDTGTSGTAVNMHYECADFKSESHENSLEDDTLQQVQETEVLLLPYKEEAVTMEMVKDAEGSSSVVGGGEDLLDFDGFGGLFDEPEVAAGPHMKPSPGANNFLAGEDVENGFLAGNSSESDPDEVDNTGSPVSIESCLAHFTKPELLSDEHAWHCENCSKVLQQEKGKSRKNLLNASLSIDRNVHNGKSSSSQLANGWQRTEPCPVIPPTHENGVSDLGLNLRKLEVEQINGLNTTGPGAKEETGKLKDADIDSSDVSGCLEMVGQTSLSYKALKSCSLSANHVADQGFEKVPQSTEGCEPVECEEEEMDSESVKVMRDATKRILISKTPHILTIHLKRFSQDARGRLSKLSGHIGFKEMIDLGPFMDLRCTNRGECLYQLVGVVEHSGSMRGGHYVAYVRGGDRSREKPIWYYASDAHVHETSLEDVLRTEAYILFYEKT
ncbi:ubiquitin-specific protease ubp2 [Ancistrocladus abbreviatus]